MNKKILVKHVNWNPSLAPVLETTTQHQQSSLSQTSDGASDMRELPVEVIEHEIDGAVHEQANTDHLPDCSHRTQSDSSHSKGDNSDLNL